MNYPYFINPDIDALPSADAEERTRLEKHIAACVGDESALKAIFDSAREQSLKISANSKTEKSKKELPPIVPVINYVAMLEQEEPITDNTAESDETADRIDAFLNAMPQKGAKRKVHEIKSESKPESKPESKQETKQESKKEESRELPEALFKMMVKNKNYAKALEIINELSLNNPKKSVYFAYQIRFLKKLIKNQEAATRRNG